MSAAQHTPGSPRPSRTYKNGIGKPVVKKCWDEVVRDYRWRVVFPPVNNFGQWTVEPEARLCGKAEDWCFAMNTKLSLAAIAIAKATGQEGKAQ